MLAPQGDCYKSHVVNKHDEHGTVRASGKTSAQRIKWQLDNIADAEACAEVDGMDKRLTVQALQGEKAGAGHLRWYFVDCKNFPVAVRVPPVRMLWDEPGVLFEMSCRR